MPEPRAWRPLAVDEDGAAFCLGISASKVRELVARGNLTRVQIGGRFVYRLQDLDRFLARQAGEASVSEANEWESM